MGQCHGMEQLIAGAVLSAMQFLGIDWDAWKVIGWLGNIAFSLRFFVQWCATEKKKEVVIPMSFWWLSLIGSTLLLAYAVFDRKDSVFIFAYAFTWIPYIRNLIIARRNRDEAPDNCVACNTKAPPHAKYCAECGEPLGLPRNSEAQPPPTRTALEKDIAVVTR